MKAVSCMPRTGMGSLCFFSSVSGVWWQVQGAAEWDRHLGMGSSASSFFAEGKPEKTERVLEQRGSLENTPAVYSVVVFCCWLRDGSGAGCEHFEDGDMPTDLRVGLPASFLQSKKMTKGDKGDRIGGSSSMRILQ